MAGGRTTSSTTKPAGARGAAGARAKTTPRGGWQFADLSDASQKAAYTRQLQTRVDAGRLESVDYGLDQLRKLQRAQPGSGGFASDDPEPSPAESSPSAPPAKPKGSSGGLPSLPSPTLRPPRRLTAADGGGFLLGLVGFALGQAYLRYGTAGVTSWFAAKFLNKPAASIVAAEGKRGVVAKAHAQLTTPGAGAAAPTFKGTPQQGKAPSQVPPRLRLGGGT